MPDLAGQTLLTFSYGPPGVSLLMFKESHIVCTGLHLFDCACSVVPCGIVYVVFGLRCIICLLSLKMTWL